MWSTRQLQLSKPRKMPSPARKCRHFSLWRDNLQCCQPGHDVLFIESQNSLGWKRPSKLINSSPSEVSRDIFNMTRLLRALYHLVLNVSKDRTSTISLGNLCWCFPTLIVKYFSLELNSPFFSLNSLHPVLSQQAVMKILEKCFLQGPFKHWKVPIRWHWSLLFSRLNNPSSISTSTHKCSILLSSFVALSGHTATAPYSLCTEDLRAGYSASSRGVFRCCIQLNS